MPLKRSMSGLTVPQLTTAVAAMILAVSFLVAFKSDYRLQPYEVQPGDTLKSVIDQKVTHNEIISNIAIDTIGMKDSRLLANTSAGSGDTISLDNNIFVVTGPNGRRTEHQFLTSGQRSFYKYQRFFETLIFAVFLSVVGCTIYQLATTKAGSFAELLRNSRPTLVIVSVGSLLFMMFILALVLLWNSTSRPLTVFNVLMVPVTALGILAGAKLLKQALMKWRAVIKKGLFGELFVLPVMLVVLSNVLFWIIAMLVGTYG